MCKHCVDIWRKYLERCFDIWRKCLKYCVDNVRKNPVCCRLKRMVQDTRYLYMWVRVAEQRKFLIEWAEAGELIEI